jgi:hypothetical protein
MDHTTRAAPVRCAREDSDKSPRENFQSPTSLCASAPGVCSSSLHMQGIVYFCLYNSNLGTSTAPKTLLQWLPLPCSMRRWSTPKQSNVHYKRQKRDRRSKSILKISSMNVTLYGLQNLPPVLSKLESRALWDLQRPHLPGITEGYSQSRRNNVVSLARMPVAIRPRFCPRRPCVPNSSQVPAQSLSHTSQIRMMAKTRFEC